MKTKKSNFLKNFLSPSEGSAENKIGLKQIAWLGFNYTCSLGFAYTLSSTFAGETGVGYHLIWIILLGSVIAGSAAWSFGKCASVYAEKNGGAMEYTLKTFGPFHGWMVGFYQYVLIPVTTPASILVAIAVSFEGLYDPNMWGANTTLYLNLISIFMYVCLSLLVLMGTIVFKWTTNFTSLIKWAMLLLVLLSGFILMIQSKGIHYEEAVNAGELNFNNFNKSFTTFFYAYTGFETFTAVGANVKNPKKTMPKAIIIVLISAVVFYTVGFAIIIRALGTEVPKNPNNLIIQKLLGQAGLILIAIAMLAQNINGFMQGAYYSGGMLQPLSDNKMIIPKINKINANGVAVKALITNLTLTVTFAFIWLVLPYILGNEGFDYASLVSFNSVVMFIVYGYVMVAALILTFKKIIKTHWLIIGLWICGLAFVAMQSIMYLIQWDNRWQTLVFILVTLFAFVWYFTYSRKRIDNSQNYLLKVKDNNEFIDELLQNLEAEELAYQAEVVEYENNKKQLQLTKDRQDQKDE